MSCIHRKLHDHTTNLQTWLEWTHICSKSALLLSKFKQRHICIFKALEWYKWSRQTWHFFQPAEVYKKKYDDNQMKFNFHSGRPNGHAADASPHLFFLDVLATADATPNPTRVSHHLSHAENRAESYCTAFLCVPLCFTHIVSKCVNQCQWKASTNFINNWCSD